MRCIKVATRAAAWAKGGLQISHAGFDSPAVHERQRPTGKSGVAKGGLQYANVIRIGRCRQMYPSASEIHLMVTELRATAEGLRGPDGEANSPLLITAKQAAAKCCKSLRTWRSWDSAGRIPRPVRIGRSTLWRSDELQQWIAAGCPCRQEWEARTC